MRSRVILIPLMVILVLGLVLPFNTDFPGLPRRAYAATTDYVTLTGSAGTGWNGSVPGPPITVTEGDAVVMTLTSTDVPTPVPHQFYIDTNGIFNPTNDCGSGIDQCSAFFGGGYPNPITYRFNATLPAGTYTYYCSVHQFMVGSFAVKGFRIHSSPNSVAIVQGSSSTSIITLASVNAFSGTASLSSTASGGLGNLLNSSSVSLASGGTSAVSLMIDVPSTTPVGTYIVVVNATIGSISHTASVAVAVKKPGFSMSPDPAQLVILQGSSKTTTITVTSLNTFNGTVSLSTGAVAGVTTGFAPPTVTLTTGRSATSTLNVTVASTATSGEYNLTLNGTSNSDTNATRVNLVIGQDFNMTVSALSLPIVQGSSANATITLVSLNNFKGSISLSSTNTPVSLSVLFNNTIVSLSPNQTAHVSFKISVSQLAPPRMYTLIVTGANGTRIRSVTLNVTVSGFVIQSTQASLSLNQGSTRVLTIVVTSINGFSGPMSLTVTGSSALTHTITPPAAQLVSDASLNVTLTFSASAGGVFTPPGSYAFNITGSVGSLSHSTTVTLAVTALPPSNPQGNFPLPLIAGVIASLAAISSVVGLWMRRKSARGRTPPLKSKLLLNVPNHTKEKLTMQ